MTEKWHALSNEPHPSCANSNDTVDDDATQKTETVQRSSEVIVIRDSVDVNVTTTDTQAAVNIQAALQVAITLILTISIADTARADEVSKDLLQKIQTKQVNNQKLIIENSREVNVTTTDTDVAVNVQLLLQILLALIARLEVL